MSSTESQAEPSDGSKHTALVKCEGLPKRLVWPNLISQSQESVNADAVTESNEATSTLLKKEPKITFPPLPLSIVLTPKISQLDSYTNEKMNSATITESSVVSYIGKKLGSSRDVCRSGAFKKTIAFKTLVTDAGVLRRKKLSQQYNEYFSIQRKMVAAAGINNTEWMERILNSGHSPNSADYLERTPLHIASCRGYTDMVRLLLSYGADPNVRDGMGSTPLHLAVVNSNTAVVTLLLEAGTDVLSMDKRGKTPLQLAKGNLRVLRDFKVDELQNVKQEVHNMVSMLLVYLRKQKDAHDKTEELTNFYSRLSLSNTSDQVHVDVKDLLAKLDALNIAR